MFKLLTRVTLIGLLLSTASAQADDLHSGIYVGADLGKSSYKQPGVSDSDPTFGIRIGYQFTPYIATEFLIRSLSFRIDGPFADSAYYPENNRSLALLGTLPLTTETSIYTRLGVGETTMHSARVAKVDYQKSESMMSIGAAYQVSKTWRLNIEASRFDKSKITLITVGTQYHF